MIFTVVFVSHLLSDLLLVLVQLQRLPLQLLHGVSRVSLSSCSAQTQTFMSGFGGLLYACKFGRVRVQRFVLRGGGKKKRLQKLVGDISEHIATSGSDCWNEMLNERLLEWLQTNILG